MGFYNMCIQDTGGMTTTHKLAELRAGEAIFSFVGPLGVPAEIDNFGTVITVTVGYSVATIVPVVNALKEANVI